MRRWGTSGFSLMEVMIAVGIGALMVGVVTVSLGKAGYKGKKARAEADIKAFEGAIHAYESEHGNIPGGDQGLSVLVEGGFLNKKSLPADPWKNPYSYVVPGPEGMAFDIISYGADKSEGGDDKNKDLKLSEIE